MARSRESIPSPEEQAEIEKSRAISDAELLKGGAHYKVDEQGGKTFVPTVEQLQVAETEMKKELACVAGVCEIV